MWCTKTPVSSVRNQKPPTSNEFHSRNSPLDRMWWWWWWCFFSRVEFPTTNNQTTEACPLLWTLNFCGWSSAQISWWFLRSASRNCYWKMSTLWCGRCTGMMYRWLLILFLVIWRVCEFVCSTNAISRSAYAGCYYTSLMQWQKVMRFLWNIICSSCTSHVFMESDHSAHVTPKSTWVSCTIGSLLNHDCGRKGK